MTAAYDLQRLGAAIARRAHNPEVAGLNPAGATKQRGYAAIGLYNPKSDVNAGGALRAARCYGASLILMQGKRFRRMPTDPQKAWRHIPLMEVADLRHAIPFDC